MRFLINITQNKFDSKKNDLYSRQININCDVITIIDFLKKRPFSFKSSHNNCVYDLKLMSVKFNSIFLDIKTLLAINDNVSINMSDIKHIFRVWKNCVINIDQSLFAISDNDN